MSSPTAPVNPVTARAFVETYRSVVIAANQVPRVPEGTSCAGGTIETWEHEPGDELSSTTEYSSCGYPVVTPFFAEDIGCYWSGTVDSYLSLVRGGPPRSVVVVDYACDENATLRGFTPEGHLDVLRAGDNSNGFAVYLDTTWGTLTTSTTYNPLLDLNEVHDVVDKIAGSNGSFECTTSNGSRTCRCVETGEEFEF